MDVLFLFGDLPMDQKIQWPLLFPGHHAVTGSFDGESSKQSIKVSEMRSSGTPLDGEACFAHSNLDNRVLKDHGPRLAETVCWACRGFDAELHICLQWQRRLRRAQQPRGSTTDIDVKDQLGQDSS